MCYWINYTANLKYPTVILFSWASSLRLCEIYKHSHTQRMPSPSHLFMDQDTTQREWFYLRLWKGHSELTQLHTLQTFISGLSDLCFVPLINIIRKMNSNVLFLAMWAVWIKIALFSPRTLQKKKNPTNTKSTKTHTSHFAKYIEFRSISPQPHGIVWLTRRLQRFEILCGSKVWKNALSVGGILQFDTASDFSGSWWNE